MNDEYLTITDKTGEGYYTEKRSKFLAFAHHVDTTDDIKAVYGEPSWTTEAMYVYEKGSSELRFLLDGEGKITNIMYMAKY